MILGNQIEVVFAERNQQPAYWQRIAINVLIDVYDPAASAIPNTITGTCSSDYEDQIIGIDIQSSTDFRCYRNIVNDCYRASGQRVTPGATLFAMTSTTVPGDLD